MSLRETFLVIHRWIGLGAGLLFGLTALTGAALVFEPELNQPRGLTRGDIGIVAAEAAVARAHPDARMAVVVFRRHDPGVYRFELQTDAGGRTVYVDAGSGAFVGEPSVRRLLNLIRAVHTNLAAGTPGHWVVVFGSLFGLVSLASGAVLWWPGLRKLWLGFRVRVRRGFYLFNFDLHQVIGFLALPILFLVTLTGVLFAFPRVGKVVAHAVYLDPSRPRSPWPPVTLEPRPGVAPEELGAAAVTDIALAAVPDARPLAIVFPGGREPIQVMLSLGGNPYQPVLASVFLDPFDGAVVAVQDPRSLTPAARLYAGGYGRLHMGPSASLVVRVLWALACLAGGLLVPTGLILWWMKRQRLADASVRRRARVPAD